MMKQHRRWTLWQVVAFAPVACNADLQVGVIDGSTSGVATSSGSTAGTAGDGRGSTGTTGVDDTGPSVIFDVAAPRDLPTPSGSDWPPCSSDLKSVLAEDGSVVQTCAPDQGCLDGECVDACLAAAGAKGSSGCEFLVPTSPTFESVDPGPCYALFVANPWDRPAALSLSRGGEDFDIDAFARLPSGVGAATVYEPLPATGVPPGKVAIIFLAQRLPGQDPYVVDCPIPPAVTSPTVPLGSGYGTAFELVSDTPVQAYDIVPYAGGAHVRPSASLLFPTSAWGDSYLAITPHQVTEGVYSLTWILVVAQGDGTTVSVNPKAMIFPGADIDDVAVDTVTEFELDAGDVVQFVTDSDFGASIVTADNRIGMFTGSLLLAVLTEDTLVSGQDSAHQMIPVVNALGDEYVGAGLFSRLEDGSPESVLYRLSGAVDGTNLYWDPEPPAGAPTKLDAGDIVEFETRELFGVRSQDIDHPFSLAQYMSGGITGRPGCSPGYPDPCLLGNDEWVLPTPPQQFLRRYAFVVDPTYATTTLVVTRRSGADGTFAPVDLECMGNIDGWMPVGVDGRYEVAHVELFREFVGASTACETSQHVATSTGDFGITVWGTDWASSYGYPAGGGLKRINDVVLDPAG